MCNSILARSISLMLAIVIGCDDYSPPNSAENTRGTFDERGQEVSPSVEVGQAVPDSPVQPNPDGLLRASSGTA